jgi:hypothetical protein
MKAIRYCSQSPIGRAECQIGVSVPSAVPPLGAELAKAIFHEPRFCPPRPRLLVTLSGVTQ